MLQGVIATRLLIAAAFPAVRTMFFKFAFSIDLIFADADSEPDSESKFCGLKQNTIALWQNCTQKLCREIFWNLKSIY